jgi:hypothetical protein
MLLVFGTCLGALCQIPYQMTLAKGFSMYAVYQGLVTVPFALPLTYFSIKYFGLVGSAFVYVLLNLALVALSNPVVMRLDFPHHWIRYTIYYGLCPAAVLITALAFCSSAFRGAPTIAALVATVTIDTALLLYAWAGCDSRTRSAASASTDLPQFQTGPPGEVG